MLACILVAGLGWQTVRAQSVQTFNINTDDSQANSRPENFLEYGSDVYFTARPTTSGGKKLYKYDGTTVTEPVDLSRVEAIAELNGDLYIAGHAGLLIKFDGTDTTVVATLDNTSSDPIEELVKANGKLYFFGLDATNGWGLFSYNGTSLTAEADITAGFGTGDREEDIGEDLTAGNGALLWTLYNDANGFEPVTFDGSAVVQHDLVPGSQGSSPDYIFGTSQGVFFTAEDGDSTEVWLWDGASMAPLTLGLEQTSIYAHAEMAGVEYFLIETDEHGAELWEYNAGTLTMVADQVAGSDGMEPGEQLRAHNGELYFHANMGDGRELYKHTPGTGISLVSDFSAAGSSDWWGFFGFSGDYIHVDRFDWPNQLIVPMSYRISTGDTATYASAPLGEDPEYYELSNGTYCTRNTGNGWEPHRINGATVTELDNLNATTASSNPGRWTAVGSDVYLTGILLANEFDELLVFDGSTITQAADLTAGPEGTRIVELINFKDTLYMVLHDGDLYDVHGQELYKLDANGTPALASNVDGTTDDSEVENLVVLGDYLYFTAETSSSGRELWRFDGSTATMLPEVHAGSENGPDGEPPVPGHNGLYFAGEDANYELHLYFYDPATNSHTKLTSWGYFAYEIQNILVVGTDVFFTVVDNANGYVNVYKWDGSTATQVVGFTDPEDRIQQFLQHDGQLYFRLYNEGSITLYNYDPATDVLTTMATYAEPEDFSGSFDMLSTPAGLLAAMPNATHGHELFLYDPGSGTFNLWLDLIAGPNGPYYQELSYLESRDQIFAWASYNDTDGGEQIIIDLCSQPTNLRVANLQDVSATILWDIRPSADLYRIQYKVTGATNWTTITKSTNCGQKTLTGLAPSTNYRYRIAAKCNGSFGDYTEVHTFTTIATPCVSPSNLLTDPITPVQARLNWGAEASAIRYKVRWRAVGTPVWSGFQKDAVHNKHWLTGLSTGTSYEWQIKSICAGAPSGAPWSALQTFSTPTMKQLSSNSALLTGNNASIDVVMMPNPNNGQFRLNIGQFDGQQATVQIFDPIGKLVYQREFAAGNGFSDVVDLSHYASGTYVIRITGNTINHTSKMVVR